MRETQRLWLQVVDSHAAVEPNSQKQYMVQEPSCYAPIHAANGHG